MTERQELIAEADELGLSFAKNAKTENIRKAIEAANIEDVSEPDANVLGAPEVKTGPTESDIRAQLEKEFEAKLVMEKAKITANMEANMASKNESVQVGVQTWGKRKLDSMKRASKLIRCNVICKDPMKASWEGEIFSVANDVIGEVKKYIPFNTDEGYHIPQIIYNVMKDKECTIFVNKRINGENVKVGKIIKAYGFELLAPLTQDELDELGRDQMARRAID